MRHPTAEAGDRIDAVRARGAEDGARGADAGGHARIELDPAVRAVRDAGGHIDDGEDHGARPGREHRVVAAGGVGDIGRREGVAGIRVEEDRRRAGDRIEGVPGHGSRELQVDGFRGVAGVDHAKGEAPGGFRGAHRHRRHRRDDGDVDQLVDAEGRRIGAHRQRRRADHEADLGGRLDHGSGRRGRGRSAVSQAEKQQGERERTAEPGMPAGSGRRRSNPPAAACLHQCTSKFGPNGALAHDRFFRSKPFKNNQFNELVNAFSAYRRPTGRDAGKHRSILNIHHNRSE